MPTLYCYVDETGQDTNGALFIVCAVIVRSQANGGEDRAQLADTCERIERETGKRHKWARSTDASNIAYMRRAGVELAARASVYYAIRTGAGAANYFALTADTIAAAVRAHNARAPARVFVLFDGLPRTRERDMGTMLRRRGVKVYKVRGVDDEAEPLIRLADATCGLVRAARDEQPRMRAAFAELTRLGVLQDVGAREA